MKYPCGNPAHTGLAAQIEGQLVLNGVPRPIFTEYRFCGCVTWRLA